MYICIYIFIYVYISHVNVARDNSCHLIHVKRFETTTNFTGTRSNHLRGSNCILLASTSFLKMKRILWCMYVCMDIYYNIYEAYIYAPRQEWRVCDVRCDMSTMYIQWFQDDYIILFLFDDSWVSIDFCPKALKCLLIQYIYGYICTYIPLYNYIYVYVIEKKFSAQRFIKWK